MLLLHGLIAHVVDLQPSDVRWNSGSTALIVLRRGPRLYIGFLGDSRVVLSRAGTAIDLTNDHTPEVCSRRCL